MKTPLPQQIVAEIEKRGLVPRQKFYFLFKRWFFWLLAVLTCILGGIAFAIVIFIFIDHDPTAYKYLHQSLIEDILLSIPYVWLAIFAVLIALTKYSVRHTQTGYRYATTKLVSVILLINLLLGMGLNALDAGERVNNFLTDTVPYYDSFVYTSKDAWSNPEKGLLGGYVIVKSNANEFTLRDFKNKVWHITVNPSELDDVSNSVAGGEMVKIIGNQTGNNIFQATQIFLWNN